jgi:hypothetical protein
MDSQCPSGDVCGNPGWSDSYCAPVACSKNSDCPTGDSCYYPGGWQAYCSPSASELANEPPLVAQALSQLPSSDLQSCSSTGSNLNANLPALQSCEDIYVAQAQALGYQANCTNPSVTNPLGTFYTPVCVLNGSGLLGTLNNAVDSIPYNTVGTGPNASVHWNAANYSQENTSTDLAYCASFATSSVETSGVAGGPASASSAPSLSSVCQAVGSPEASSLVAPISSFPTASSSPGSGTISGTPVAGYSAHQEGSILILSGDFPPSGSTVSALANPNSILGGTSYGMTVTSQSATQIEVSLIDITPASYEVLVSNVADKTSILIPFTMTAISGGGATTGSAVTQATNSAPQLVINGVANGTFTVGQAWALTLGDAPSSTALSFCAQESGYAESCTPNYGTTDANGSWTQSGSFPSSTVGSWTEWIQLPSGTISNQISFTVGEPSPSEMLVASTTITFPATILVTVPSLNVRSAPNTSASLAGSQTLSSGDIFTATNEVVGESVDGSDLWWVSSEGNYVWSGGTEVMAPIAATIPKATKSLAGRLMSESVTAQVLDGNGNQVAVTYSYLPDGEVSASFTFTYPNVGTNFPAAARGTQQYIYQAGFAGVVLPDGSVQVLNAGNDCTNFYGAAGCVELYPAFTGLIKNIKSNAPAAEFPPGLTFETPPGTASGTYLLGSTTPVTIATDRDGNILSAQSVNTTGYGSGFYWYNLGNGFYIESDEHTPDDYLLYGTPFDYANMGASGFNLYLSDFSVATDANGVPQTVSGRLAWDTIAAADAGTASLSTPSGPVTFSVTAASSSQTVDASGLDVLALNGAAISSML